MNVKYCVLALSLFGSATLWTMAVPYVHVPRDLDQRNELYGGHLPDEGYVEGSTKRYCTSERVATAFCCTMSLLVGGAAVWALYQNETYQKNHFGG